MWKNLYENVWKKYNEKYREVFWYLVCGVGTTIVNLVSFWCCTHIGEWPTVVSTCVAWLLSVSFAYVTNRTFVFHSTVHTARGIWQEAVAFFGARVCSGALDVLLMVLFVDCLHLPEMWMKMGVNVLVTVLNYIASKWIIFAGKQKTGEHNYVTEN